MRWDFGSVLKEIRQAQGLSQARLGGNTLSRFAISKIEANQSIPTVEHMVFLLEQLNMSLDEFLYICNLYQPSKRQNLLNQIRSLNSFGNSKQAEELVIQCEQYLKSRDDVPIQNLLDILKIVLEVRDSGVAQPSEELKKLAKKVWDKLETHDIWFWSDLQLLNVILFYFPMDTIIDLTDKILNSLAKYNDYRPIKPYEIGLLNNLATIYLYNGDKKNCERISLLVLDLAKEIKRYDSLAFAQVRLGICRNDDELIDRGLLLLQLAEENDLLKTLEKELKKYH